MKFEIITDNEDMLVLVVHSRVFLVSHDLSVVLDKITEIYTEYGDKKRLKAEKAEIVTRQSEINNNKRANGSLGSLLDL